MAAPTIPTIADLQAAFTRFTVTRLVRPGGQGAVFEATRNLDAHGNPCADHTALKLYLDPTQKERLVREINALHGYDHPNISRLIEHGGVVIRGVPIDYVAWEYIAGAALDSCLTAGPLQAVVVARVGRDVARAIDHIWKKRIVHRDVKPPNIILRAGNNEAVLIDLGVARHLDETTITGPGIVWGTRGYYSPEQSRGETQLTCQSDVFALGVVLLQCLAARHPTNGDQYTLTSTRITTARVAPHCPAALAAIIDAMVHPRAAFRPTPTVLEQEFATLATIL